MPRGRKSKAQKGLFSLLRGVFFGEVSQKRKPRVILARNDSEGPPANLSEIKSEKESGEKTAQARIEELRRQNKIADHIEDEHQENIKQTPDMWDATLHHFALNDEEIFDSKVVDPEDETQNEILKKLEAVHKRSKKPWGELSEEEKRDFIKEKAEKLEYSKEAYLDGLLRQYPNYKAKGLPLNEEEKFIRFEALLKARRIREEEKARATEARTKKEPEFVEPLPDLQSDPQLPVFDEMNDSDFQTKAPPEQPSINNLHNEQLGQNITEADAAKPTAKIELVDEKEALIQRLQKEQSEIERDIEQKGATPENWKRLAPYSIASMHGYSIESIDAEITKIEEQIARGEPMKESLENCIEAKALVMGIGEAQEVSHEQKEDAPQIITDLPVKIERAPESSEMKEKIDELLAGEVLGSERVREAAQKVIETRGSLINAWPNIFEQRRSGELPPRIREGSPEEEAYERARDYLISIITDEKEPELRNKGYTDKDVRKELVQALAKIDQAEELRMLTLKEMALPAKRIGYLRKFGQYINEPLEKVFGKNNARHARIALSAAVMTGVGAASGMGIGMLAVYGGYRIAAPYVAGALGGLAQLKISIGSERSLRTKLESLKKTGADEIRKGFEATQQKEALLKLIQQDREVFSRRAESVIRKNRRSKLMKQVLAMGTIALLARGAFASLDVIAAPAPRSGLSSYLEGQKSVYPERVPGSAPSSEIIEKPSASKDAAAKEMLESVSKEQVATASVSRHGLWGAAQELRRQGAISLEQFNEAWEKTKVTTSAGKEIPISEAGFVKDAQLRFNTLTHRFEVFNGGEYFKVGTNQNLHEAFQKAGKPDPQWLKIALVEEQHQRTESEFAAEVAARASARPAGELPPEFANLKLASGVSFNNMEGFKKWLDGEFAGQPLWIQEPEIEELRKNAGELRYALENMAFLKRPKFEELASIVDQKVAAMEKHPSYLEQKMYWADKERELREQLGLSRQQFSDLTHKWTVKRLLEVVQSESPGSKGKLTELERELAQNHGAIELAQYIKRNGGGGLNTQHLRVGEFLKITA